MISPTPNQRCLSLSLGIAAVVATTLLAPTAVAAQTFELTPFVGYVWGGSFNDVRPDRNDLVQSDFSLTDSASWGVIADLSLTENWQIEAIYNRQETEIRIVGGFLQPGILLYDLNMEYLQGGILYQWLLPSVRPYISGGLGGARFNPTAPGATSETRFAINLGGGVKVLFTDHLGLRADLRWYSAYISDQDELFCDPFFGCYRANVGEYMNQFQAAGGLILAF